MQPYKNFTLRDICKESIHVKHLLFWILFPVNYVLLFTIRCRFHSTAVWEWSLSLHVMPSHSAALFVASAVFHIVYYLMMWKRKVHRLPCFLS